MMGAKLVECEHCRGQGVCTVSGGRSCRECLSAAGRSVRQWGTVRCSYCGGTGRVWVEEEDDSSEDADDDTPE